MVAIIVFNEAATHGEQDPGIMKEGGRGEGRREEGGRERESEQDDLLTLSRPPGEQLCWLVLAC
jgi:hypothetical protein